MYGSGYLPAGAEFDPNAPWNVEPNHKYPFEVDLKIINYDDDGNDIVRYETVDLEVELSRPPEYCGFSETQEAICDAMNIECDDFEILGYWNL